MSELSSPRRGAAWPDVADAVRRTMRANKGRDTIPEKSLRSAVHAAGYRFRVHVRGLPGTPDIALPARRKAVWMHGCFWHAHPGCRFATVPRTRVDYWVPKLARNRERDADHAARLLAMGWDTMVVWECEMKDVASVVHRVGRFLGPPRLSRKGGSS